MDSLQSIKGFILLFLLLAIQAPLFGNTYYLDFENGDDSRSGLSPGAAFKSLEKASTLQLMAGDSLLLKRGSIFMGTLNLLSLTGSAEKPIIISAYGTAPGVNPTIDAKGYKYGIYIEACSFLELNGRVKQVLVNHKKEKGDYRETFELDKFKTGMYIFSIKTTSEVNHQLFYLP